MIPRRSKGGLRDCSRSPADKPDPLRKALWPIPDDVHEFRTSADNKYIFQQITSLLKVFIDIMDATEQELLVSAQGARPCTTTKPKSAKPA